MVRAVSFARRRWERCRSHVNADSAVGAGQVLRPTFARRRWERCRSRVDADSAVGAGQVLRPTFACPPHVSFADGL